MTTAAYPGRFEASEAFALAQDARDPLAGFRERFHLPQDEAGRPLVYFCSHSLGLQAKDTRRHVEQVLEQWARLGLEGHFKGPEAWYTYLEHFRDPTARLAGAQPDEVVLMNGLTINLHLLMETFYRPEGERTKILIEEPTFPSDLYAVKSQLRRRGLDPAQHLLTVRPRPWEHHVFPGDIDATLEEHGRQVALVLLGGVNFFTGQFFDLPAVTARAHAQGCVVGFDLAHAVGNVPLALHDGGVDFAVWCTYKYLGGGPGAIAGCFVHERHGNNPGLHRLAGWWGNDPATRFRMQLEPEFVPHHGAAGWQVSNPPVLALAPLRASLGLFDEAGMPALRAKSVALTGFLEYLLDRLPAGRFEVITPRDPARRGCQLSLLVHDRPRELFQALAREGVVGDFREPNVIRVAPVPLYNTFYEVRRFAQILARHVAPGAGTA
jgi:kynureninase